MGALGGMSVADVRLTNGFASNRRSEGKAPARRPGSPAGTGPYDEERWRQVLARDGAAAFFYAVTTTGVFCRPSCASRRPARANVRFFADASSAAAAGFRPCLRCRPAAEPRETAFAKRLTAYLDEHRDRTVPLAELAKVAGVAPGTVRRLFLRTLGLSPRAWTNARRAEAYRALLTGVAADAKGAARPRAGGNNSIGAGNPTRITDAVYEAGFSSSSRAHGAAALGMEARRYRAQGTGEDIGYVVGEAPGLGKVLVAATGRGVCAVLLGDHAPALIAELTGRFPRATLHEEPALASPLAGVLAHLSERPGASTLPLDLRGTAFQARVWAALRTIPRGQTRSYAQLAASIGAPKAVRAVAAACGQNPAAILVPCHRVVGSSGALTGYRWGLERKRALLDRERDREG